jgi:hypothetical protein
MRHVIDDGKVTVSLGLKDWAFIVGLICAVAGYVVRLEMTNTYRDNLNSEQDRFASAVKAECDSTLARTSRHEWKIRRLERKMHLEDR